MYLITIHVPIFVNGNELLLATDWKRSVLLLRDSFAGRFGRVQIVAPSIVVGEKPIDQLLEAVTPGDEIDLFPSFAADTRAREFWAVHLQTWRRDIAARLSATQVVHSGFCDVYRPMLFTGHLMGVNAGKATVFVQDTDRVLQIAELTRNASLGRKLEQKAYAMAFERCVRYGVRTASLSLLKGQALHARYGRYAKNPKNFHDTSFLSTEVIAPQRLEDRLSGLLSETRPLRLVYCGRLDARKGVDHSVLAVAEARARGADVTFDIIGDGAERVALEKLISERGLSAHVRLLGARVYGPGLLDELGRYDALLFTPLAEDTPRMIFDGYAAGLPLLGYGIEYVREREREDGAARSVTANDESAAATLLLALQRDRAELARLSRQARKAALHHAADSWYRRRADWTIEAVARHEAER